MNARDPVAFNNRGNALLKKGHVARAIADYDQAIRLDSQYVAAYFSRAIAQESRRRSPLPSPTTTM